MGMFHLHNENVLSNKIEGIKIESDLILIFYFLF